VRGDVWIQAVVGSPEYHTGRHEPRCFAAQDAVGCGHHERGGDALARDVAGDERDLAVG